MHYNIFVTNKTFQKEITKVVPGWIESSCKNTRHICGREIGEKFRYNKKNDFMHSNNILNKPNLILHDQDMKFRPKFMAKILVFCQRELAGTARTSYPRYSVNFWKIGFFEKRLSRGSTLKLNLPKMNDTQLREQNILLELKRV